MRGVQASEATIDLLESLVGFPSISSRSNLDIIGFIDSYLDSHGVPSIRVPDLTGQKANLFATIGPPDRPGIILSGHTDVVPVEGQTWSVDPFQLTRRDGRLLGRGTCDMKGFLAVCLALVPEMTAANLDTPIHLAFSHDEEVGCVGVRSLVSRLNDRGIRPLACLVGEPTSMGVIIAHKGKYTYRVTARGVGGHSSRAPELVNAVEYAARFVTEAAAAGRRLERDGLRDPLYDVTHSTVHVGIFWGGEALNVVPDTAVAAVEIRFLPEDDIDAIVGELDRVAQTIDAEMRAKDPRASFAMIQATELPGFAMQPDAHVVTLAQRLAQQNTYSKVAFGTEAAIFVRDGGIPSVVCGPGSIEQAHKPDEFIEESQLAACELFVRRLVDDCCRRR